jgi:hypothetical protein
MQKKKKNTLQIGAFCFTNELAKRGYVWQFITLAGFHSATVSRTSKAVLSKSGISKYKKSRNDSGPPRSTLNACGRDPQFGSRAEV